MVGRRLVSGFLSLVIILAIAAAGMGCTGPLTGSAVLVTQEMDFSDFTRLDISSAFTVDITRGDSYRVSITADDNLFSYLNVYKVGNTLHVGLNPSAAYIRTTQRAVIVMPDLERLDLSGASSGRVRGFSVNHLMEIELSGTSSLAIANMAAGRTRIEVSGTSDVSGNIDTAECIFKVTGASNVVLTGAAEHLDIEVSGASKVDLSRLPGEDAEVILSGPSNAIINTGGRLDAELSGASLLEYTGNSIMGDINIGGGARLSRK